MVASPQLSVVISVYNGADYLAQMIDSVLAQTFRDFEFVIVDDGSTDQTPAILQRYQEADARIRVLRQANQGTPVALNAGLAAARCEIIARIDADDRMLPQRLEKQLPFLNQHPEAAVVSCLAHYVNKKNKVIGKNYTELLTVEDCKRYIRDGKIIFCLHPGAMFRKSAVLEVGGYRDELRYSQDTDLWNRLADHGHYTIVMPEILVEYRVHPNASMSKLIQRSDMDYWVIDCAFRRRRGEKELTLADYRKRLRLAPWPERLEQKRIIYRNAYYRTAGLMYGSGRYVGFLLYLLASVLLGPRYVYFKLRHQFLMT